MKNFTRLGMPCMIDSDPLKELLGNDSIFNAWCVTEHLWCCLFTVSTHLYQLGKKNKVRSRGPNEVVTSRRKLRANTFENLFILKDGLVYQYKISGYEKCIT